MKGSVTGCQTLLQDIQNIWNLLLIWLFRLSYSFIFYGCMFCILLFNFVSYVFLFLYLCILIVLYVLYILFSSCQLALFGYPDWGFSVLFRQLTGHGPHSTQLGDNFYAASSSLILVSPLWLRIPESLPTKVVNCVVLCIVSV